MASKRHRQLKPARVSHDKMAAAHRHRLEDARRVELDTEITGTRPRAIGCPSCGSQFVAAEVAPTCPDCGRTLVRRTR